MDENIISKQLCSHKAIIMRGIPLRKMSTCTKSLWVGRLGNQGVDCRPCPAVHEARGIGLHFKYPPSFQMLPGRQFFVSNSLR